ncbi:SoxW family protein [Cupriavidus basilensis]
MRPLIPTRRPCVHLASALLAIATLAGPASAGTAHLPRATDLAAHTADAARRGEPLVILVSLPDCGYCETVRKSYLGPQAAAGEIAVRELDMTADTPLRDTDGTMTTARAWARAHQVRVAPTVLFLDRDGKQAAGPLRGLQPDFYGAYLEQALGQARATVAAGR